MVEATKELLESPKEIIKNRKRRLRERHCDCIYLRARQREKKTTTTLFSFLLKEMVKIYFENETPGEKILQTVLVGSKCTGPCDLQSSDAV